MLSKRFEILEKEFLTGDVVRMRINAPLVASHAKAGQFFIVRVDEKGERIPLTLCDFYPDGTIESVFQVVGTTTAKLSLLNEGDSVLDIVGPLGKPTNIDFTETRVACAGGGVGIAAIYPIARALIKSGKDTRLMLGARDKEHLILLEKIKELGVKFDIATDDGSLGIKGFVTEILEHLIHEWKPEKVIAVGPVPMMMAVSRLTGKYSIPTVVSLNPIMLDGTGMCGTCRVQVGGETRFACVDGPEFDGHEVDWGVLSSRLSAYKREEEESFKLFKKDCQSS